MEQYVDEAYAKYQANLKEAEKEYAEMTQPKQPCQNPDGYEVVDVQENATAEQLEEVAEAVGEEADDEEQDEEFDVTEETS